MENASKALIIAGAILLAIAIIAIAVGVVSKTGGVMRTAENQISSMERKMHNNQLLQYESNRNDYDKTFEEMRECVRTVMSMNFSNQNNRENIIAISPYVNLLNGGTSAYWYVDDKENNYQEQKKKGIYNAGFQYGASKVTIQELYNYQDTNQECVININKYNKSSLYNIKFDYDFRGVILHVKITKKGPVGCYKPKGIDTSYE